MLTKLKSKWGLCITPTALLGLTIFIFSSCAETIDTNIIDIDINTAEEQSSKMIQASEIVDYEKIIGINAEETEMYTDDILLSTLPYEQPSEQETTEVTEAVEIIEESEDIEAAEIEKSETAEIEEAIEIMATAATMASVRDEPPIVTIASQNTPSAGTPTALADSRYVVFNDRNIVQTMDMRQKSNVSEEILREYLLRFPNLLGIAPTLIEVQETYSVNAIMLLAIIRLESGNGQSHIAVSKNNLGGIIAPANSVAVHRSFDSKEECVIFMARLLSNQYLTQGGRFFNGYTLVDINKRYSVSDDWSTLVGNLMVEIQATLNKISEHFEY